MRNELMRPSCGSYMKRHRITATNPGSTQERSTSDRSVSHTAIAASVADFRRRSDTSFLPFYWRLRDDASFRCKRQSAFFLVGHDDTEACGREVEAMGGKRPSRRSVTTRCTRRCRHPADEK